MSKTITKKQLEELVDIVAIATSKGYVERQYGNPKGFIEMAIEGFAKRHCQNFDINKWEKDKFTKRRAYEK